MVCYYCSGKTRVVNSRHQKRSNHIWRRRQCERCRSIFTSLETPKLAGLWAVQTLNDIKPFSRDRLFITIYESLKHRKTAVDDATALTDTVIYKLGGYVVDSKVLQADIVALTQETLKRFDQAAAMYYQVYHSSSG